MSLFGTSPELQRIGGGGGVTFSPYELALLGRSPYASGAGFQGTPNVPLPGSAVANEEARHSGEILILTGKMRSMQTIIEDLEQHNMMLSLSKGGMQPWSDQEEILAAHVNRLLRDNKRLQDQVEEVSDELKLAKLDLERARISEASVRFQLEHQMKVTVGEESDLRLQMQQRYEQALIAKESEWDGREAAIRSQNHEVVVDLKMKIQVLIAEHEEKLYNAMRIRDQQIVVLQEKEDFLQKEIAALREELKGVRVKAEKYKDDCRLEVDAARRAVQQMQEKEQNRRKDLAEIRSQQEGAHADLVDELDRVAAERDQALLENENLIGTLYNTKSAHQRQMENVRLVDEHLKQQAHAQAHARMHARERLDYECLRQWSNANGVRTHERINEHERTHARTHARLKQQLKVLQKENAQYKEHFLRGESRRADRSPVRNHGSPPNEVRSPVAQEVRGKVRSRVNDRTTSDV